MNSSWIDLEKTIFLKTFTKLVNMNTNMKICANKCKNNKISGKSDEKREWLNIE